MCLAPRAKFVVLERAREDVVRSFDEWTSRESLWTNKASIIRSIIGSQRQPSGRGESAATSPFRHIPKEIEKRRDRCIGMSMPESRRLRICIPIMSRSSFPVFPQAWRCKKYLTFGIPEKLQVLGELKRVNSKAYRDKRRRKLPRCERKKRFFFSFQMEKLKKSGHLL